VQGVEGNGQSSNCGRTNKEGIGFIKANKAGYERYVALYRTPESENGCAGCRFFLMCKGQCPGTSVGGDWRNRTEHCGEWKHLFRTIERRMISTGKIPLTIQPLRFELEERQVAAWERGENPSISRTLATWYKEHDSGGDSIGEYAVPDVADRPKSQAPKPQARISWVSERARERWEGRLERLHTVIEEMTVYAGRVSGERCAVRLVPISRSEHLLELAAEQGLSTAILPLEALPRGICTSPAYEPTGVFLAGAPAAVANAQATWADGDLPRFRTLLDLPACCACHESDVAESGSPAHPEAIDLPQDILAHSLLAPLGISTLPIEPCRFDCPLALEAAAEWLALATVSGYATEVDWLRECFSWAISWSELHGVTEVKTPLFKMCFQTASSSRARLIRRIATAVEVEGSVKGLSFPYAALTRQTGLVEIGGVL
jgi:radical SAM protein with 4Fe4S-binding SPASM domain